MGDSLDVLLTRALQGVHQEQRALATSSRVKAAHALRAAVAVYYPGLARAKTATCEGGAAIDSKTAAQLLRRLAAIPQPSAAVVKTAEGCSTLERAINLIMDRHVT